MNIRCFPISALSAVLLMAPGTSYANVIVGATGTVTCSSDSIEFTGVDLNPSDTYSVQFSFTLTPTVGAPITISGVVAIPPGTNGPFDVTKASSLGPLMETYTISSGSATLFNGTVPENTITIVFTSPTLTCTPPSPVTKGDGATIGFWHNKNGQEVINSFNGGSTATMLANWLATSFPNLFGAANPYTGSSLAGFTNAQIASVYSNLWTPSGVTKNTYVQAFALALNCYATSASLGANATTAGFGFNTSPDGTCSRTFNVGSNGAAFGVSNGTTLTVFQVIAAANANFNPTTGLFYGGDQVLTSDLNNVLADINSSADIS
jgi:hypothetical protein